MTSKLKLLKGGKALIGGGGSKRRRPARANPLNELLFHATSRIHYKTRAGSVEQIAQRMTNLSKRVLGYLVNVTPRIATHVIADGRKRRHNYDWMLVNVEKGSEGFNRGYVPVLTEVDKEDFEWFLTEETDVQYIVAGNSFCGQDRSKHAGNHR